MTDKQTPESANQRGQSLGTVIKSVAASMIGVQSRKNHEEDFAKGKLSTYITIGLIATLIFILSIWGIVKLVSSIVVPQ